MKFLLAIKGIDIYEFDNEIELTNFLCLLDELEIEDEMAIAIDEK